MIPKGIISVATMLPFAFAIGGGGNEAAILVPPSHLFPPPRYKVKRALDVSRAASR